MIVVDAAALFEVVTHTAKGEEAEARLSAHDESAAPHLVDAEVLAAIHAHRRLGFIDQTAADQAVEDLGVWPGTRWSHRPLLDRAWELRHNVRAYDALYVALAESLEAKLLTLDRRLSRAPGLRCEVEVL